jgi:hypothetical protein
MLEALLEAFVEYGPYVGLALGINAIMTGLKTKLFPEFFTQGLGSKFLWVLPLVLGLLGGLLLNDDIKTGMLTGLGIGAVSHYFYKFFTKTLGLGDGKSEENLEMD